MKKALASIVLAVLFTANVSAQDSDWSINTRAWSTNYFTTLLYDAVAVTTKEFILDGEESGTVERIIPTAALVFPFSTKKSGFGGDTEIFCPYHRAFSNPIANIGDYGIGFDASWKPSAIGIYAGAYFKSQEVVFKNYNSIRGYYIQPRLGVIAGLGSEHAVEAGVFYDALTGCGGKMAGPKKDKLRGGFGLDFALSTSYDDDKQFLLQISIPLHNFFSKEMERTNGFDRRVGYIMLTSRIKL